MAKRTHKENIRFFPYVGQIVLVGISLFGVVSTFFMACVVPQTMDKVFLVILGFVLMVLGWVFSVRTTLLVEFNQQGVFLQNVHSKEQYFAKWEQFAAAYFVHDSRGHTYLLLTRTEMNFTEKKACWKSCMRIIKGKPVLSSEGNVCVLLDRYCRETQAMIQDRFPSLTLKDAPRVEG